MKRRAVWVLLLTLVSLAIFQLSLFSVGAKEFRFSPMRQIALPDAPGERFVSLRVSWLRQVTFADGKEGRFQTTYDGPVELITQSNDGLLRRRRAWGVELIGQHRRNPMTIRLK